MSIPKANVLCSKFDTSKSGCEDQFRVRTKGSLEKGSFQKVHFLEILEKVEILENP